MKVASATCFHLHVHTVTRTQRAWTIIKELVVGYMEEDDEDTSGTSPSRQEQEGETAAADGEGGRGPATFRIAGQTVKLMAGYRKPLAGDALVSVSLGRSQNKTYIMLSCALVYRVPDTRVPTPQISPLHPARAPSQALWLPCLSA